MKLSVLEPNRLSVHPSIHPSIFLHGTLDSVVLSQVHPHPGQVILSLQGHRERQITVLNPVANFKFSICTQAGNFTQNCIVAALACGSCTGIPAILWFVRTTDGIRLYVECYDSHCFSISSKVVFFFVLMSNE